MAFLWDFVRLRVSIPVFVEDPVAEITRIAVDCIIGASEGDLAEALLRIGCLCIFQNQLFLREEEIQCALRMQFFRNDILIGDTVICMRKTGIFQQACGEEAVRELCFGICAQSAVFRIGRLDEQCCRNDAVEPVVLLKCQINLKFLFLYLNK